MSLLSSVGALKEHRYWLATAAYVACLSWVMIGQQMKMKFICEFEDSSFYFVKHYNKNITKKKKTQEK